MVKRKGKKAQLYVYDEYETIHNAQGKAIVNNDPTVPGTIRKGEKVTRSTAHKDGIWHGNVWMVLFKDATLDKVLIQHRSPEKMSLDGNPVVTGTRITGSAMGHIDVRIRLKKDTDPLPFRDLQHKVAYAELSQELFYDNNNILTVPDNLVLVELGYIRHVERRNLITGLNREHVWLYTGICPPATTFSHDPDEAKKVDWVRLEHLYRMAHLTNGRRERRERRRYMTDEFAVAMRRMKVEEVQQGGRQGLREYLAESSLAEYKRIIDFRSEGYRKRKIDTFKARIIEN